MNKLDITLTKPKIKAMFAWVVNKGCSVKDKELSEIRTDYEGPILDLETSSSCPFEQFDRWFNEALQKVSKDPNAMCLATTSKDGQPEVRNVLLKYFDKSGFVFFTNYDSRKAKTMEFNPKVCLHFTWLGLHRQIEIQGVVTKISTAESIKYFLSRPRDNQIAAWISKQSSVISSRQFLINEFQKIKDKFKSGEVPLPPHWGGYKVSPTRFEYWQGQKSRLHNRVAYIKHEDNSWQKLLLAP